MDQPTVAVKIKPLNNKLRRIALARLRQIKKVAAGRDFAVDLVNGDASAVAIRNLLQSLNDGGYVFSSSLEKDTWLANKYYEFENSLRNIRT